MPELNSDDILNCDHVWGKLSSWEKDNSVVDISGKAVSNKEYREQSCEKCGWITREYRDIK